METKTILAVAIIVIFSFIQSGESKPQESTSTKETCKTKKCPPGTQCVEKKSKWCYKPPCPRVPVCIPVKDCSTMNCPLGTKCVQEPTTNCSSGHCPLPPPKCVPITSCSDIDCPSGTTCVQKTVYCTTDPCPPPSPVNCVTNDPDACLRLGCPDGTTCNPNTVKCVTHPCPQPQATCDPVTSCSEMICPNNGTCVTDWGHCTNPLPHCDPKIPLSCSEMECPKNTQCVQDIYHCEKEPCPQPEPKCVPITPPCNKDDK